MAKAKTKVSGDTEPGSTDDNETTDDTTAEDTMFGTEREDDKTVALKKAESAKVGDDGMPEHDSEDLEALKGKRFLHTDPGHAADVEVNPPEAQQNHADWFEGREPNDVVEVSGQRETVEARMARNGQASPERAAGATTLSKG